MSQLSNLKFPQIIITVVRKKYGFKFFLLNTTKVTLKYIYSLTI